MLLEIPTHTQNKVVSAKDAVSLISNGDTICVSGFVGQGSPDKILEAIGNRYDDNGSPCDLTLLFGGGPGDWNDRGLNYLARHTDSHNRPLLRQCIGSHYGQVPKIANMVKSNVIAAWALPLGSISRMIRSQVTHSPGHITTVGIGTYVDPDSTGGAINDAAKQSSLQRELVTKLSVTYNPESSVHHDYLLYKALPIQVAIIRATTADSLGNLSLEEESLLCDQRIIAAAAKNSGGIVLAQVKRLASDHTIPTRQVAIPGAMVDCVVVVNDSEQDFYHPMSYENRFDPVLSSVIRSPGNIVKRMDLNIRKVIARRASFALKPGKIVNLGIGLPEGVASVANEEGMLHYITLTTEPGVFGGLPASGKSFGPATNADALISMNEMFDYYDGGGLDISFLGAGQISKHGDVNVSRISKKLLTGPGGFIDISQSTRNICFLATFTTKGLQLSFSDDGDISIKEEGKVRKFVSEVNEVTFSGNEAARRGQKIYYVTERAVFQRTGAHDVIELIEIAPGVRLKEDILDQMDFEPVISSDLKEMDRRIFMDKKMGIQLFGSIEERINYYEDDHVIFINMFGVYFNTEDDIVLFHESLDKILKPLVDKKGPIDVVVNYDGFDINPSILSLFNSYIRRFEKQYYKSVKRFAGKAFRRASVAENLNLKRFDQGLFESFDKDKDGIVSTREFREGMRSMFGVHLTPFDIKEICKDKKMNKESFVETIQTILDGELY